MLKNNFYKISILLTAFALGACHDELLNPVPESVLTTANAFNTAKDLNLAVLGVYSKYQDRLPRDYEIMEAGSDNLFVVYAQTAPGIEDIDVLGVSEDNPKINTFWKDTYNVIFRANSVLANIDNPSDYVATSIRDEKAEYIGEVKFMRALMYFDLVRIFGGVPAVTTVLTNEEARVTPRSSEEAIYELIITDLKDAILNLPKNMPKGRATKGAAIALLAKVYVYRENWPEAKTLLEDVVENYGYDLVQNYRDLFEIETEDNSETIFSVPYVSGTDGQNLTYELAPIYGIRDVINNGNRVARPTWDLHTSFEPGDSRFEVTIEEYQLPYAEGDPFWYPYFNKWIVPTPLTGGSGLDIPVLRLGDMVLLYAEVLYHSSQPEAALDQINRIRERAFGNSDHNYTMTDIPDEDAFINILLKERRLELAVENNRWFDLVRTGKYLTELTEYAGEYSGAGDPVMIEVDVKDYMKYFPIPWEQIQLAGKDILKQNEGYN